jgi:hypothetical protein
VSEVTPKTDCKTSIESGISIEEQQGKGIENRNRSRDGESNVNDRKFLHSAKLNLPMVSTELGIQIECSEVVPNAQFPICESLDPDSKVILSSDVQREKQLSPRISTDDGTQIDFSDEQR